METRTVLWFMLFFGIIVHTIVLSNINITIPVMVKKNHVNHTKITNAECRRSSPILTNFTSDDLTVTKNNIEVNDPIKGADLFDWSKEQQNLILCIHFAVYGIAQLFGGYLCHRYGSKKVWGFANLLLGISSFLTPVAAYIDYTALIALRILQGILAGLGIAGGPTQLISKWVPPHDRAKYMTTLLGNPFGIAISYLTYGFVIHWSSWEYTFYISGCLILIWCILCKYLIYDTPASHPRISISELKYIKSFIGHTTCQKKLPVPWKSIVTSRPFLINISCKWGVMWALFTLSMYMPTYLTYVHGLPIEQAGAISGLPFFLKVVFAMSFSAFTDHLLFKNVCSRTNVRKLAVLISGVIGGIFLLCVPLAGCNTLFAIILLASTMTLNGGVASGVIPNLVDMSPNYSGVMEGIAGFVTSFTGFLSPLVVNYLTPNNTIPEWNRVFIIIGLMYLIPGILFVIFADSEVQSWNNPIKKMPKECHFLKNSNEESKDQQITENGMKCPE